MNIHDIPSANEARIRFMDADFRVVTPGTFVRCAITGRPIPIDELKYWSVARQEAYVDVHASLEAERQAGALPMRGV